MATTTTTVLSDDNENLPSRLTLPLPFDLVVGRYVNVKWQTSSSKGISFNLTVEEDYDKKKNVPLHYTPRFADNQVVRNSVVDGAWGAEERHGGFPFKVGVTYELKLVARADFYECFVDGVKHVEYKHRLPMESAKYFTIYGNAEILRVDFGDENPSPLTVPLPFDLAEENYVVVRWKARSSEALSFNFTVEQDYANKKNVALHYTPRFKENEVVRNSMVDGAWGVEERHGGFPFNVGVVHEIMLVAKEDFYECYVDGVKHVEFNHRLPMERVKFFTVYGDAEILSFHFGEKFVSVLTVPLPFDLAEGRYVAVRWHSKSTRGVSFNFSVEEDYKTKKNVLLHYTPRFKEGQVVRNSLVDGTWGSEERDGGFPFKIGETKELKLVVRKDFYECLVDGVKHVEYTHRMPMERAKFFTIYGDAEVLSVDFGDEAERTGEMTTPYEAPCEISPGRKIFVSGTADADVNRFWIFLKADADYAFVLIVKMMKKLVLMNSRIRGSWKPKKSIKGFPFEAGKPFNVLIEVEADKLKVSVNDKPLAEFKHRVLPLTRINKVRVDERAGKLELHRVTME